MRLKTFTVGDEVYSEAEMLATNASDHEFCDWLANATAGDYFPDGEGCLVNMSIMPADAGLMIEN